MFIADAKKSEENVSVINKKIAASGLTGKVSVAVVLASMLSLAACGGGGSGTPATGGSTGGPTACADIPGEPDILGQVTFTPSTTTAGQTVMMNIPIDAETVYVGVTLANASFSAGGASTNGSGGVIVPVTSTGAQTLQVPVIISPLAPADSYFPSINICSGEIGACEGASSSAGTAITYTTVPLPGFDSLSRFKNFENGSAITPTPAQIASPSASCVAKPVLTVTAP